MQVNGFKKESVTIEVKAENLLRELLKLTLPVFSNDTKVKDGYIYEYERGYRDYEWERKRVATQEEIDVYGAYQTILSKVKGK